MKGRLIVFEGLDGSGKSTAAALLRRRLEEEGRRVLLTQEPSGGPVGRLIRGALTHKETLHPETLAPLFAADRFEHVKNEILPAIQRGADVLCDRYYYSNVAYQGDVVEPKTVLAYNDLVRGLVRPDFVFFIDTRPEECLRRIHANRAREELFERLDKLKSVRRLYEEAFRLEDDVPVRYIDGSASPEAVLGAILGALKTE